MSALSDQVALAQTRAVAEEGRRRQAVLDAIANGRPQQAAEARVPLTISVGVLTALTRARSAVSLMEGAS